MSSESHIQTTYRLNLDELAAGQYANAMETKVESGILVTGGTNSYPASLPFGFACGWLEENRCARNIVKNPIATLGADVNAAATTFQLDLLAGIPRPSVGSTIIIDGDESEITAVATGGNYTVARSSGATSHTSGDNVTMMNGGSSNFAGVAVRNVALPGNQNPVDTYNDVDHVSIGSEGDFVVVTTGAVSHGDRVSIYVGSTAADYGKFTNHGESSDYIGVPDAMFIKYKLTKNVHLAVLRLPKQPT